MIPNILTSFNFPFTVNPQKVPEIIGLRPEYTTEETIQITCKSERSYPAAELNFFIDNEAVRFGFLKCFLFYHRNYHCISFGSYAIIFLFFNKRQSIKNI